MAQTDHLGRETASGESSAQTVTGFAVEQGTLDSGAPGVSEALEAEEQRRQRHTEHAERMSELMAPTPEEQEEQEERQETRAEPPRQ